MKKTKKLLLTLSIFLCVLFSNASCVVNSNVKRSAAEQTVFFGSSKKSRPDSFVRPASYVGTFFFETARRELEREIAIQKLLNSVANINDLQERDKVTRSINLHLREVIASLRIEERPRKLTINSEVFVTAVEDARLELQREEEAELKERLKELVFDKTDKEFIQDFITAYFKIIKRSDANLITEDFKQRLILLFRRMLLNNVRGNSDLRFSMIYSLMLQEHLFFDKDVFFISDESCYLLSTMCWVLSEKFLYDQFYKTREYFDLVFPVSLRPTELSEFLQKQEMELSEFLQKQEIDILTLLEWKINFPPDQIKDFVEKYFSNIDS